MSDVRTQIRRYLERYPGTHVSGVVRSLELGAGQVQYHLDALRAADRVTAERYRGRTHYFPSDVPASDRKPIAVLRRETAREIVVYLIETGPSRPAEVTDALGIARGTLEYHLEALIEQGLLAKHHAADGGVTLSVADPEPTLELVAATTPSRTDRLVDRFTRLVDTLLEGDR